MLETDYPAGEEVPQDLEASQGDGVSLAGSVASVGSTGSDGAMAAEGTTAIPQTAGSGVTDQATEHSVLSGSGTHGMNKNCQSDPSKTVQHGDIHVGFTGIFLTVELISFIVA